MKFYKTAVGKEWAAASVLAEDILYLSRHLATYPQPLPYEKSIHQKIKKGMAIEISCDMMGRFPNETEPDDESGIKIVLDEDQQNYILGRRIKG